MRGRELRRIASLGEVAPARMVERVGVDEGLAEQRRIVLERPEAAAGGDAVLTAGGAAEHEKRSARADHDQDVGADEVRVVAGGIREQVPIRAEGRRL